MDTDFFRKVYSNPLLSAEDIATIKSAHEKKEIAQGTTLLRSGKTAGEFYIVEQGLFRSWLLDYNGNEITTGFYCPGELLIDSLSLFQRQPARENLQALTAATVWAVEYEKFLALLNRVEGLREWGRNWATQQLFALKQHSINSLTTSAADRYLALIREKPEVIRYSPLKYIASFLGITDTSLSRIRKEISTS